jgi:hypothetical protein
MVTAVSRDRINRRRNILTASLASKVCDFLEELRHAGVTLWGNMIFAWQRNEPGARYARSHSAAFINGDYEVIANMKDKCRHRNLPE